jgi:hypothetical protein
MYGKMLGSFNSTFISLIPKKQDGVSFIETSTYFLLQCYLQNSGKSNFKRLKPILSDIISEEQFGFLQHRQIHDAVAVAQEALHSVKKSNQQATILKLDLSKAYDRKLDFSSPSSSSVGDGPSMC